MLMSTSPRTPVGHGAPHGRAKIVNRERLTKVWDPGWQRRRTGPSPCLRWLRVGGKKPRVAKEDEAATSEALTVIRVSAVVRFLALVAGGLLLIHLLVLIANHGFGHGRLLGLVRLLHFDREANLPTWFSSVIALVAAALFAVLWRQFPLGGRRAHAWLLLSFCFCYISIDEVAQIHEQLMVPVRERLDLSGLLYFSWVVPYGLAVLILAMVLLPFVRRLDSEDRGRFITAAVVYLTGALGVELIGGWLFESLNGQSTLVYDLVTTCEETLEMAGLILLIRAQLLLLRVRPAMIQLGLG